MAPGGRYPLVVAFAPSGNPGDTLGYLTAHADQRKFLVFASSDYQKIR